jgi:hypothetical protein
MPRISKGSYNEKGSTLPLVLCVLFIISAISSLLIQMSLGQFKQIAGWKQQSDLELKTEALLNQCEKYLQLGLEPFTHPISCCVIEASPYEKSKRYFRVSVIGMNKDFLHHDESLSSTESPPKLQSRLQSVWLMQTHPATSNMKHRNSLQRISWREVIDLDWEYSINKQQREIWENLSACNMNTINDIQ